MKEKERGEMSFRSRIQREVVLTSRLGDKERTLHCGLTGWLVLGRRQRREQVWRLKGQGENEFSWVPYHLRCLVTDV